VLVRRQKNSSFANFGRVSACAICKCAVLCVGCSLYRFSFLSFCSKITDVVGFSSLVPNVLVLGAVADFGAQNCQYSTKFDAW
jgi:hypothetical protein